MTLFTNLMTVTIGINKNGKGFFQKIHYQLPAVKKNVQNVTKVAFY